MKTPWLIPALLVLPLSLTSQNSRTSVEGEVVDRVTSEAIVGATVLLTGIAEDRVLSYTAKTSAGGRFAFANVAPSSGYWLMALHGAEHVQTLHGQRGLHGVGTQIAVGLGQQIRDLKIAMLPTGEISGRVVDAGGKPVSDAQVLIMRRAYQEDTPILSGAGKSVVRTNRRGEYRVTGLEPGLYYVRVGVGTDALFKVDPRRGESRLFRQFPGMVRGPEVPESDGYPFIYFPGTPDEGAAQAIPLRAGAHVDAVDVTVAKVHNRRVRGFVVDSATGLPVGPANLLMVLRNAGRDDPPVRSLTTRDGTFDLRRVLPGAYFLVAEAGSAQAPLFGRIAVEVGPEDIRDLKIPMTAGFDLIARISLDGASSKSGLDTSRILVTLRSGPPSTSGLLPAPTFIEPRISGGTSSEAGILPPLTVRPIRGVSDNGTLAFRVIQPWDYAVEVSSPFEDLYVKLIRLGARDVLFDGIQGDTPLRGELEIVMGSAAGRIDGRVLDAAQKPVEALRVVLIPDEKRRGRKDLYRTMLTDDEGRFQFWSLPPGDYKIFAWEFTDERSWLDPDFLRLYEDKGTPVRIQEGSNETRDIRPLPPWY